MSFILEALKKADSERRLGELPGLHSQALPAAGLLLPAPVLRRRLAWLLASLPIFALALWIALQFWSAAGGMHMSVQLRQNAPRSSAVPPPSLALAPTILPNPTPTPAAMAAPVINDISLPPPMPVPAPPAVKSVPAAATLGSAKATPADAVNSAALSAAVPANRAATKPMQPSTSANLITDLPLNLQREIPKLAIAGSIYSADPVDRMLLIDKRMLHEGDEISPGLVLETVLPKAATLRYKGYAFRVVF